MRRRIYEEDHEAFRSSVRAFVERSVLPHVDEHETSKGTASAVLGRRRPSGLLGLEIPDSHGGSEAGDYRFTAVLTEELAKVNVAVASCHGIHADIVAPYLVSLTTPEQRKRWLPSVASGETLLSIGMTEPSGGSDLAALRTTARPDGDGWLLNGSKTFITNGYTADLVVVAARTSPDKGPRGISLFGVEAQCDGFSRGRKLDKIGQPESDTAELFFEDVRVGPDDLIGELDQGFVHMMQNLPQERLNCAVANLANARQILDETLDYVRERQAFGQPVGSFQHNKFLLAELVTTVEVAQFLVDECVFAHVSGELSAVDAAKVKYWTSDVQNDVLDKCVQLHGGYGFMSEYRAARAWRDARVTKIWAGTNEIMKELIGRDLGL